MTFSIPGSSREGAGSCREHESDNSIPIIIFTIPDPPGRLREASGSCWEHESYNSIPIITFSVPDPPGRIREASEKLPEAARSTKVNF